MAIEVQVRQWGNSKAIILPKEYTEERQIKVGDTLVIAPLKKANLKEWFGKYPDLPSGQEIKDQGREDWT